MSVRGNFLRLKPKPKVIHKRKFEISKHVENLTKYRVDIEIINDNKFPLKPDENYIFIDLVGGDYECHGVFSRLNDDTVPYNGKHFWKLEYQMETLPASLCRELGFEVIGELRDRGDSDLYASVLAALDQFTLTFYLPQFIELKNINQPLLKNIARSFLDDGTMWFVGNVHIRPITLKDIEIAVKEGLVSEDSYDALDGKDLNIVYTFKEDVDDNIELIYRPYTNCALQV